MRHASLFSGIGGFDLAAQWMGWENVFQVEIDEFCQKVLAKNFPNAKQYGDIKQFDGTKWAGKIDILSGGFPCQPFSSQGKREGAKDNRYLWPEMLRIIGEIQPEVIVGENVFGIINQSQGVVFEQIQIDLEDQGYETTPIILPACGKDLFHVRSRVWFIAHSTSNHRGEKKPKLKKSQQREEAEGMSFGTWIEAATHFHRVADGLPSGMDRRNKHLGNAIVPQVAFEIFKAIELTQPPQL